MGLLNGAPTFLGQFGAYFVLSFFYCWLAFVFGENLCVAVKLWFDWLESLEGGDDVASVVTRRKQL